MSRIRMPGNRSGRLLRGVGAPVIAVVLALTAASCSTGNDAAVFGGSFTFVSPGGQTEFAYPVADRGTVADLSGPDLIGAGTLALSDYAARSWC